MASSACRIDRVVVKHRIVLVAPNHELRSHRHGTHGGHRAAGRDRLRPHSDDHAHGVAGFAAAGRRAQHRLPWEAAANPTRRWRGSIMGGLMAGAVSRGRGDRRFLTCGSTQARCASSALMRSKRVATQPGNQRSELEEVPRCFGHPVGSLADVTMRTMRRTIASDYTAGLRNLGTVSNSARR